MSIDRLQDKIRKMKNPSMLELAVLPEMLPPGFSGDAAGCGAFCRELLEGLKGTVPALRVSFASFALMGSEGLTQLQQVLHTASALGYYVAMDAPGLLTPALAEWTAKTMLGEDSLFPCDGLVISGYAGSDVIKPFLPYCRKQKKDLFVVARTANRSAPELQDLLAGTRLVHAAAADHANRYGEGMEGKHGYTRVGVVASASSAGSLRSLRANYPKLFFLLDGYDYPNSNAKNCSYAFDQFGHGAVACGGEAVVNAWRQAESDGSDWLAHAQAAADRMKKNLTRYVTIL